MKRRDPHQEPGRLAEGVTRFIPTGVLPESLPRSFALKTPLRARGPVPETGEAPRFERGDEGWTAWVSTADGTSVYGTGEIAGPLRRNCTVTEAWAKQPFRIDDDGTPVPNYDERSKSLYQAHPWVLAVRRDGTSFGLLADTTYRLEMDLTDGIRFRCSEPFPVIAIEGDDPPTVLRRLAQLTGTMELPPRWTLGYHQSRFSYHPDREVQRIAGEFRARQIPCDGLWIDIHYMDAYKVFTFDPDGFPDPAATNAFLHDRGFKSVWILDPAVKVEDGYDAYEDGRAGQHFVVDADGREYHAWTWPGDAAFPDFTRPETRRWWMEQTVDFLNHDMDGLWVDLNEPSPILPHGAELPEDLVHRGGGDIAPGIHAQYHNVYGMLMSEATRDAMLAARPERRPFVLTRSSYLGGHRYAATWTGDNVASVDHLRWSVSMVLNLGLSGQPNSGPDIGGFAGTPSSELYAHWIGLGAFLPFCRTHHGLHGDQEPWSFGAEVEEVARVALQRRYRLLLYLYTVFWDAATTGLPVARPLFFADPSDPSLIDVDGPFLLGPDVLVQPVLEPGRAHPTVTPGGTWRPFTLVGEDPHAEPAHPILRLREGAALPVGPGGETTEQAFDGPLTLIASLDRNGTAIGRLYEDAGDGYGYRTGEYRLTTYEVKRRDTGAVVRVIDCEGNLPPRDELPAVVLL
jgi:alpha-glucosidase